MHTFQYPQYDTAFCECRLCDTDFWVPFKALFIRDDLSSADLDIDADISHTFQHLKPGPNIVKAFDSNLLTSHSPKPSEFHQDVSGAVMAGKWPRIFDTFAHRAFKAGEQPDGLQVPAQWVDLIGGIPNLSDMFHHHLFGQHEICLEIIKCG